MYTGTGDIQGLLDAGKAAFAVADDPHLPEMVCHVFRLAKMEEGKDPGPPCPATSIKYLPGKGVGLRYAIVPVRAVVKIRERPYLSAAAVGGIMLGIFALGFAFGRRATRP